MGVSRSATLVLAFLMICENLTLVEAINAVRQHRDICPNAGFLSQLRRLERTLAWDRKNKMGAYRLATARDKATLSQLGITHVVNAAAGPHRINTDPQVYADVAIEYRGVEAADNAGFDLRPFFHPTAEFIQKRCPKKASKVLVHCGAGISRAPSMVLAYLMICEDLTLVEAINAIEKHRHVFPNEGFLDQLRHLDTTLSLQRRRKKET
ncbi:hypothetical protein ANANG_G00304620 [Anguilla anguilla]|uniref:Dual specificity protein phosphatase n=1 Tax=Anguilla anguilla TaxID=7936 RepID=A0A9D3LJL8_ANGAN|nr:hypothetical protein ANANG_G00304620 [Anguilla anguilla]